MKLLFLIIFTSFSITSIQAKVSSQESKWAFTRGHDQSVRGGNSIGVEVEVTTETTKAWKQLQASGIDQFEKDRRAILALQGEFKTTFEFMETILLDTQLGLDTPYASWGTEFVKLVEDEGDRITLQHILVMTLKDPNTNELIGPYVVKHWRQEWQWEADDLLVFKGDNHWDVEKLSLKRTSGKWKWTVFQVDDTPRYSTLGAWEHFKSASTFSTHTFSRPLPRREFSVRSDYKLLLGNDTLVLTPNAWFHEQKNFKHKTKLNDQNSFSSGTLLSREIGHNSYLRIKNYDFSIGYEYLEKTLPYWNDVNYVWREILSKDQGFKLKKAFEGKKLFSYHFKNAQNDEVLSLSKSKRRKLIRDLLNNFLIK